ncbi:hypothetical protein PARA125_000443 [Parachlamydia sp. AcF125]|nr:hypothetical protein [Parachlamydia sp. AcF125]
MGNFFDLIKDLSLKKWPELPAMPFKYCFLSAWRNLLSVLLVKNSYKVCKKDEFSPSIFCNVSHENHKYRHLAVPIVCVSFNLRKSVRILLLYTLSNLNRLKKLLKGSFQKCGKRRRNKQRTRCDLS